MYWRIVRINGDGSLRLMYIGTGAEATGLNTYAGEATFNIKYNDPKYAGYTYDNSSPNVQDGTPSDIKNYLDKWYDINMKDEDANIAVGQFFSDTTRYEENDAYTIWYDMGVDVSVWTSSLRLGRGVGATSHAEPTLKTSITKLTYGGIYYLKTGLISADELALSGTDGVYVYGYGSADAYPYTINTNEGYWSISPAYFGYGAVVFNALKIGFVNESNAAFPVINLSAEAAQSLIGNGSSGDPYRLAE